MKNNWFNERKKINLEVGIFRVIVIGCFLFVALSSIFFLIEYLIPSKWLNLLEKNKNIFGIKGLNLSERQNMLKLTYLIRFWGSIGTIIILQLSAYIYFKKTKHGLLFPILWSLIILGLIIVNIIIVKNNDWYTYFKLVPLIILFISILYELKEILSHRKLLNLKYYKKIKKGEIKW